VLEGLDGFILDHDTGRLLLFDDDLALSYLPPHFFRKRKNRFSCFSQAQKLMWII